MHVPTEQILGLCAKLQAGLSGTTGSRQTRRLAWQMEAQAISTVEALSFPSWEKKKKKVKVYVEKETNHSNVFPPPRVDQYIILKSEATR